MTDPAATFAAVAITLYAAHQVADHVFGQTDRQANGKAAPGRAGWGANLGHVQQYHLVLIVMLAVANRVLDLHLGIGGILGLLLSAGTHAVLDRRWPVRWILTHAGGPEFAKLADKGLNGMYLGDQALHYGCLWLTALVMVRPIPGLVVTGTVAVALTVWILTVRHTTRIKGGAR